MLQVQGHEWAINIWKRSLARDRIAHAYLLTGPAHIGKTMLAKYFAQTLNCSSDDRPCGQCLTCRKIEDGNHPDVRIIEAVGGSIKIDQVRQLQSDVSLSAHESRWKVHILCDMDQATPEAANCLLKTLEEPPSRVVLILTASNGNLLLPTIVSRCQVLPLRALPQELVEHSLYHTCGVEPDRAKLLGRLSRGRIGWAVTALQDEALLRKRSEAIQMLMHAMTARRFERMGSAEKLSAQKDNVMSVLEVWSIWWRDLLLVKLGADHLVINIDQLDNLRNWECKYNTGQIRDFMTHLLLAAHRVEQDANPRLALEALLLKLPLFT